MNYTLEVRCSLGSTLAITLEDPALLKELCGPQDDNLKVMEGVLGVPLYTWGNEIHIDTEDAATRGRFKVLLDEMLDHVSLGQSLTPALIRMLGSEDESPGGVSEYIRAQTIVIPGGRTVVPKTLHQARYIEDMLSREISFAIGPAGTGKTFLAVAVALAAVLSKEMFRVILTRPVVEAGESLGFLPGDLAQKLSPYLRPLYDAMESLISPECVRRLEESRGIEIAPLAYMRGRSLSRCFIILDEGQNTTREQMKMFLTRMGEGSRMVVTGDITQIDLPNRQGSGLIHAAQVLEGIEEIGINRFSSGDVIRHPLVGKIVKAYEEKG